MRSTATASILTWRGWAGVERRGCVRLEGRPSVVGDGGRVRNTCARLPVANGGKPVSDDCRWWRSLPRRWVDREIVSPRRQVSTRSGRPVSGVCRRLKGVRRGVQSWSARLREVREDWARCRRSVAKGGRRRGRPLRSTRIGDPYHRERGERRVVGRALRNSAGVWRRRSRRREVDRLGVKF